MKRFDVCAMTYYLYLRSKAVSEEVARAGGVAVATAIAILKNARRGGEKGKRAAFWKGSPAAAEPPQVDFSNALTVDNFLLVPQGDVVALYLKGAHTPLVVKGQADFRKVEQSFWGSEKAAEVYGAIVQALAGGVGRVFDAYKQVRDAFAL